MSDDFGTLCIKELIYFFKHWERIWCSPSLRHYHHHHHHHHYHHHHHHKLLCFFALFWFKRSLMQPSGVFLSPVNFMTNFMLGYWDVGAEINIVLPLINEAQISHKGLSFFVCHFVLIFCQAELSCHTRPCSKYFPMGTLICF